MGLDRLALKNLSASDLTFFAHFADDPKIHQKSINLNADVFIAEMYPGITVKQSIPVQLEIYGPAGKPSITFTRKIIRSAGSKNWRLDGEVIPDSSDDPGRFHGLSTGDFGLFLFVGDLVPQAITMVLVSQAADKPLWGAIRKTDLAGEGRRTMTVVQESTLQALVSETAEAYAEGSHPLRALTQDEAVESVVLPTPPELSPDGKGPLMTQEALAKQIAAAGETGLLGEQLVANWLETQKNDGTLASYQWISIEHARASYDFSVVWTGSEELVEVKSTKGAFDQPFFVSRAELAFALASSTPYRIYRVFNVGSARPSARIIRDARERFGSLKETLEALPEEVRAETFQVAPGFFGDVTEAFELPTT